MKKNIDIIQSIKKRCSKIEIPGFISGETSDLYDNIIEASKPETILKNSFHQVGNAMRLSMSVLKKKTDV